MKKLKTIKIKKEHRRYLKSRNNSVNNAKRGLEELSAQLRSAQEEFWKTVIELYPETKDKQATYYPDKHEFKVML